MTGVEVEKVIRDIKALKIQGNTNIAKTVAKTILEYLKSYNDKKDELPRFVLNIKKYSSKLANARPNEPLAVNAVKFFTKDIENCETYELLKLKVSDRIVEFFKYVDESYEIIRENAEKLLSSYKVFYTHCHSSLSRDVLIRIHKKNKRIIVINDETRPMLQGRTTANKLSEAGIRVIHTLDSAVASVFLDDRYSKPDVVIVGSDGITVDGELVNKVGTYNIALAAKEAGVPFYVVTQFMKLDVRSKEFPLDIEQRSKNEVWKERPANVDILNPAFDLVPAKFITGGYITEKGLLDPEEIKEIALRA